MIMNCLKAEECLSEYMESGLRAAEMKQVKMHLEECSRCSELLDAMRLTVSLCRNCPDLEMGDRLLDGILARTSGSPARMSFYERFTRFFVQPLLRPRYAFGTGLTILFFAILVNLIIPRMPADLSTLSPSQIYAFMDRSVQRIYSKGLKAYDIKNEWQAQLSFYKDNMIHRLQFMMERFDVPTALEEGPVMPDPQRENSPRVNGRLRLLSV
jgi:hypothetical protein